MAEPLAFWNGKFVPQSQAVLHVYDAGFVLGTAVSEQLRTFGGKLFRLTEHLQRLGRSLAIVGVEPGFAPAELAAAAEELVRHNHPLLAQGDDLGLAMFVTPGPYPTMAPPGAHGPTVCMHTFPLPFGLWADQFTRGQRLVTTDVLQVPEQCWPAELKCRSRMHYFLADQAARRKDPLARAVMLDGDGCVTESTTANIVVFQAGEGLITPPRGKILPGISLATLLQLAGGLGIPCVERDLRPKDLAAADELYLTSTSPCLLPVTNFDGVSISQETPGGMYQRLVTSWGELVGVDIVAQAKHFRSRS